jgi:hypothetical protein
MYYPSRGPSNGANPQKFQGFGYMLGRPHLNDRLWARLVDPKNNSYPITEAIEIPSEQFSIDEWSWTLPPVTVPNIEVVMEITLNM